MRASALRRSASCGRKRWLLKCWCSCSPVQHSWIGLACVARLSWQCGRNRPLVCSGRDHLCVAALVDTAVTRINVRSASSRLHANDGGARRSKRRRNCASSLCLWLRLANGSTDLLVRRTICFLCRGGILLHGGALRRRAPVRLVWLRQWEGLTLRSREREMAAGLRSAEKRIRTAPSVSRPRPGRQSHETLFESTGVVCKIDLVLPVCTTSEPLEGDGTQKMTPRTYSLECQLSCCGHPGTHRCSDRIQHVLVSATPLLSPMSKRAVALNQGAGFAGT